MINYPHFLNFKRLAGFILSLCAIALALHILRRQTENMTFSMIESAIGAISEKQIMISVIATFISFFSIGLNEVIAVKTLASQKLSWRVPFLAGTAGNALGNTLGFHTLTISAWRYKVYSKAGLSLLQITAITGVTFIGIVLGFLGIAAISFLLDAHVHWVIAAIFLLLIMGFLAWISTKPRQLRFKRWSILLPGAKYGFLQLIVGMIDLSAAIFSAYILLPVDIAPTFAHFSLFYIAAVLFGIASHTPGGLGVFEAGMLTALAAMGRADVLAALLLYRLIYNLIPFGIACITATAHLMRRHP